MNAYNLKTVDSEAMFRWRFNTLPAQRTQAALRKLNTYLLSPNGRSAGKNPCRPTWI